MAKRNKKMKINKGLLTTDRIYISGPMSGMPNWNFDLFNKVDALLREQGYEHIFNPATLEGEEHDWVKCMKRDISIMCQNDVNAVVLLDGWTESKGATMEIYMARAFDMGTFIYNEDKNTIEPIEIEKLDLLYSDKKKVITDEEWQQMAEYSTSTEKNKSKDIPLKKKTTEANKFESILTEASGLVNGARQNAYGHPLDNWGKTAAMFSVIFGVEVTAEQAVLALIATKMCRELNAVKRDNIVDIAGYSEVINMITHERKRREKEGI
jgi:hypothetical protein